MASLSDCGQNYRPLWAARREMSTEDKGDQLKGKAQFIRDSARTRLGVVVVGGQDIGPRQALRRLIDDGGGIVRS